MIETPYIGLVYGLIGVLLFRFQNSNKNYLDLVSISTLALFASELLFFKVNEISGLIAWGLSGLGLISFYLLRHLNNERKRTINYLKILAIVLVACYPLNFYTLEWFNNKWDVLIVLGYLILPIAGTIYLYDRWILKPDQMKTKFIIALVTQTILLFMFLIFAIFQHTEAKRQESLAVEIASEAQAISARLDKLTEDLEKCKSGN